MTRSYFLQLNNTDNLETVIKKCNTNFGSFSSTANRSTSDASADVDLTSLIDDIEAERSARESADTDLDVLKAPLASPALTGTPTAPTAAAGTNTTQIATTAFVMTAIASAGSGSGGSGSGSGSGNSSVDDSPIGTIIDFAGSTLPSDYLECDGSAVSRTDYADLFAVLGTTWGAGDGSTTFNLPDLRGRVSIGAGTGTAGGATAHSMASYGGDERMQSHSHPHTIKATTPKLTHSYSTTNSNKTLIGAGSQTTIGSAAANGTHYTYKQISISDHAAADCTMSGSVGSQGSGNAGNMQPFATVKKIIKVTLSNGGIEALSNSEIDALWTAA